MTPENIHLVQRSIHDLLPEADQAADAFLKLLVLSSPRWSSLIGGPAKGRRFGLLAGFVFAVETLDDLPLMQSGLYALGRQCEENGIGEAEKQDFGAALTETLAEFLGPRWTPELADAWAAVAAAVVEVMCADPADRQAAA